MGFCFAKSKSPSPGETKGTEPSVPLHNSTPGNVLHGNLPSSSQASRWVQMGLSPSWPGQDLGYRCERSVPIPSTLQGELRAASLTLKGRGKKRARKEKGEREIEGREERDKFGRPLCEKS
jgi:hypothetical protein